MTSRTFTMASLLVALLVPPALTHGQTVVQAWEQGYKGPANVWDEALAVVLDTSNNVIVMGQAMGSGSGPDYGTTIKYSSAGVPLWTNRYSETATSTDFVSAMAVDHGDDIIVTGYSWDAGISLGYVTIKYSSAGVPLWTNRYNGPARYDTAMAVMVDHRNNVIVTGNSASAGAPSYNFDYATIKYSSGGVPLWTNRYNGPANSDDWVTAMAVDGNCDVIVTGYSAGVGSDYDYATIKYSSAGVPLWTNRYNGPSNSHDQANAVAVDRSNNVIVTGYAADDYMTIKYSSVGLPLWTNRFDGSGHWTDFPTGVAIDRNDNAVVTGYSRSAAGDYGFATIKYVCVPSPTISGLLVTNGIFGMVVGDVLQPGTLVIEVSTNLVDWSPVFTNTRPTDALFYSDPAVGKSPTRFYRAYQFP